MATCESLEHAHVPVLVQSKTDGLFMVTLWLPVGPKLWLTSFIHKATLLLRVSPYNILTLCLSSLKQNGHFMDDCSSLEHPILCLSSLSQMVMLWLIARPWSIITRVCLVSDGMVTLRLIACPWSITTCVCPVSDRWSCYG